MSRFNQLHTLAACLAVSLPILADERNAPLTLPTTAITDSRDAQAIDLATPTQAGSRLNLNALETPASTSSLSEAQIIGRNNQTVQDAVTRSPGITFIGTPGDGGTGLSARGFTGQSSVMTLLDGSRMHVGAGTLTYPVDPWMVERIDVIRGPASVLYGEGATGAVVNVIPKKPFTGEIRNHLRLGYGSWDRQQLGLDSGGSLDERLSYRLTLNQQAGNGWVDRTDSRSLALSAALRFDATDDLSFTLSHERGDAQPANYYGTPLIDGHLRDSLRNKNYNVSNDQQRYHDEWTRLSSDWQISDSLSASNQLYYIKSRRHWRNAESYTWDAQAALVQRGRFMEIRHGQEQVGDRQSFTFDHSLFGLASKTVVGAEYNRIRFTVDSNAPYDDGGRDPLAPWQPAPGSFHSASATRPQTFSKVSTFSLFGENRTQLSDRLSLVTGLRRDQNRLDFHDLSSSTRSDRSLQGGNWRAGLVFAVTDALSLYGQYSTSEDGVGDLLTQRPGDRLDLTEARQTEVGLKQRFWEDRGEWTLAAYHIVKKKLPVYNQVTHDSQQAGQQTSDGLEASVELALGNQWHVSANAALLRARYDDFIELDGNDMPQDRAGKHPQDVPRRTANLWLSKGFGQDLDAGIGLRYVDVRYSSAANDQRVPGYTVVDANIGWQVLPDVRLGLQVNNLFDRVYAQSSYSGEQWLLGAPRSYFATLDYSF